jgi:hypothetical protein
MLAPPPETNYLMLPNVDWGMVDVDYVHIQPIEQEEIDLENNPSLLPQ